MHLQQRQEPTIEQELTYSDTSSRGGGSVLENQLVITTSVPGDNRYGEISSHMGIRLSQDQFAVRWLMGKEGQDDRMDW